mmetsp:Transcript_27367/g.87908  ORF Transcript_27367/g.87908 Transcript_27367/m.87908 type:complete len:82 (+) Transcript_27367:282-527(+)
MRPVPTSSASSASSCPGFTNVEGTSGTWNSGNMRPPPLPSTSAPDDLAFAGSETCSSSRTLLLNHSKGRHPLGNVEWSDGM